MHIVTREEWGAKYGRGVPTSGAKGILFIHHAAQRSPPRTLDAEIERWRYYERLHAEGERGKPPLTASNPRIGYTVGFTQSGRVLEGCGLGYVGAHTKGRNSSAYGGVFLLDGSFELPTPAAIAAYVMWKRYAIDTGHLAPGHAILGHRDQVNTSCPGDMVYNLLVRDQAALVPVSGFKAITPMPTLRVGSGGARAPEDLREAVRELQRRMKMADEHRTGYFGPVTLLAVRAHQRAHHLTIDGIVGPQTWKTLIGGAPL